MVIREILVNDQEIGLLKYTVQRVRLKKLQQNYVRGVGFEVLPLIKYMATELHNKWIGQIEGYIKKLAKLEKQAMQQIRENVILLKRDFVNFNTVEDINKINEIMIIIVTLEDVFDGSAVFIMPSQLCLAWDYYSKICYRLCFLSNIGIVKKYVAIVYSDAEQKIPFVEAVLGTSYFSEHNDLERSFESSNSQSFSENIWKSYEYLMQLRWSLRRSKTDKCAHDPYDFFRKKLLYHQQTPQDFEIQHTKKYKNLTKKNLTAKHAKRDAVLMDLYFRYQEVRAMENDTPLVISKTITFSRVKDPRCDVLFEGVQMVPMNLEPILVGTIVENVMYTREKIDGKLDIVLNEIYKFGSFAIESLNFIAISLHLKKDQDRIVRLYLYVQWTSHITAVFCIHRFQDLDNVDNEMNKFTDALLRFGKISLDPNSATGVNATKYLQRIGIIGVLDEIFIAQKMAFTVKLTSQSISIQQLSPDTIKKLLQHIEGLEFQKWKFQDGFSGA